MAPRRTVHHPARQSGHRRPTHRRPLRRAERRSSTVPPAHQKDEVFLLLKGTALVWTGEERHELAEDGVVVYLPRNLPHGYRITSERADLLLIATPGGMEEMFRHAGRDITTPRPDGFEITTEKLAEAAALRDNVILGPPR